MSIEIVGFDWDGTLVDSMIYKSEAFADAVHEFYPETEQYHDEIRNIYLRTRGNPRTHQLDLVQEKYDLEPLNDRELQKWSDTFTGNYIDEDLEMFDDAVPVIEELKERGYMVYLSSSVPQDDLDETIRRYGLENLFEFVLGTQSEEFVKGPAHVNHVCKKLGSSPEKVAFVGDSPDDVKGANKAGSLSVGIADGRMPDSIHERMRSANADYTVPDRESILKIKELS